MAKNPLKTPAAVPSSSDSRRIQTRRSGVHGKGVFALVDIAEGETIISDVHHIDRGYDDLVGRLCTLGANITRL